MSTHRAYVLCVIITRQSIISLCAFKQLVIKMEEHFVLCGVRTKYIN